MAATKYTYSISEDFPNGKVDPSSLAEEIADSSIVTALDHIETGGDDCDIWFKDALSAGDETTLDGIVANHSGAPTEVVDPVEVQGFRDLTGYNVYRKGYQFTAEADTITNYDAKYTADMKLQGLEFRLDDKANVGDTIAVQVVDVDGLFYPAGTVLVTFAEDINCWPNREFECICEDAKDLVAGLYLRFKYDNSSLTDDVEVCVEHCLRTVPA